MFTLLKVLFLCQGRSYFGQATLHSRKENMMGLRLYQDIEGQENKYFSVVQSYFNSPYGTQNI